MATKYASKLVSSAAAFAMAAASAFSPAMAEEPSNANCPPINVRGVASAIVDANPDSLTVPAMTEKERDEVLERFERDHARDVHRTVRDFQGIVTYANSHGLGDSRVERRMEEYRGTPYAVIGAKIEQAFRAVSGKLTDAQLQPFRAAMEADINKIAGETAARKRELINQAAAPGSCAVQQQQTAPALAYPTPGQ